MAARPHYYGDVVRKLFLVCGLVMLITLPFLKGSLSGTIFYSLIAILLLAFFAGITNPRYPAIIVSDMLISLAGFVIFAYQAIEKSSSYWSIFFATNLLLAVLFLLAFYWCIKTLRGAKFPDQTPVTPLKDAIVNASEDTPAVAHHELSEEDRRRNRFLGDEN